jgi:hypothetical protein
MENGLGPLFDEATFQNHKHGIEVDAQGNPIVYQIYCKNSMIWHGMIEMFTLIKEHVHID